MEHVVGQYKVTCSVHPSPQVIPFITPHLRDLRGLSVTLAAIIIIINKGLFLHSLCTVSSVKLKTFGVINFGVDSVCKICNQLQKKALS